MSLFFFFLPLVSPLCGPGSPFFWCCLDSSLTRVTPMAEFLSGCVLRHFCHHARDQLKGPLAQGVDPATDVAVAGFNDM